MIIYFNPDFRKSGVPPQRGALLIHHKNRLHLWQYNLPLIDAYREVFNRVETNRKNKFLWLRWRKKRARSGGGAIRFG